MNEKPVIAAFDFDGTVTYHDSLLPFLTYTYGYCKTYFKLLLKLPTLLGFVFGWVPRQKAKETIISSFFKGESIETIRQNGRKYAEEKLNDIVRPEAKKRIQWHLDKGHQCILISASLDIYLAPWTEAMGFTKLLCSKLETTDKELVTGKLQGANCWGPEKVRRLEEACGLKEKYTLYAYGDSRGDQELLKSADHPFFRSMGESNKIFDV